MIALFAVAPNMPHWPLVLAVVALLQWLVFAGLSLVSAEPVGSSLRTSDRNLAISSAAVVIVWLIAFDARSVMFGPPASEKAALAAEKGGGNGASCVSVEPGMSGAKVKSRLGPPTQVINEEDTRGPGSKLWYFRNSRCAVHMCDDIVELTE